MKEFIKTYGVSPYRILGLSETCSLEEAHRAYKRKALILHPDKTGGKTANEFTVLRKAYLLIKSQFEQRELLKPKIRKEEDYVKTEFIRPEREESFTLQTISSRSAQPLKIYQAEEIVPSLKKMSLDEFNQTFSYYKDQQDREDRNLVKYEGVQESKETTSLNYSKVYAYNGILVDKKEPKEKKIKPAFRLPQREELEEKQEEIKNFKPEWRDKEVKIKKYSPHVDVQHTTPFSDDFFLMQELTRQKKCIDKHKEKIYADKRISTQLLDQAKDGQLDTSLFREEDLQDLSTLKKRLTYLENR